MKLLKNSLLTLAPNVSAVLVSIATVPFYLSMVGPERFGALLVGLVLLDYFGQADFGLGRAVTQRISSLQTAAPEELASIVWSALAGGAMIAVAGGGLVYLASVVFFGSFFEADAALKGEGVASAWVLALCVPVVILTGVSSGSLVGRERFGVVSIGTIMGNVLSQSLPLAIAALHSAELVWLLGASLVGRGIGMVIMLFSMWRVFLRRMPVLVSREQLRSLFAFGSWIMVSAIVGPLMVMSDRVALGAAVGAAAVVAYSVPFQIASRTVMMPFAVAQAMFPRLAAQKPEDARALAKMSAVLVGQSYALVVVGLICLAGPLLELWLGDALDPRSVLIGQIVLIGFWANAIAYMPYSQIQAAGNSRFTALLHVAELPVYFALLFGLGWAFGLYGIALAFGLRTALDCGALLIKAGFWDRELIIPLAGPLAIILTTLAISFRITGWAEALAAATVCCGVLLAVCWLQMPPLIKDRLAAQIGKLMAGKN